MKVRGKNIMVVSGFFAPERTPRAFRTEELIKELLRRGDFVTGILPPYARTTGKLDIINVAPVGDGKSRLNTILYVYNYVKKILAAYRIRKSDVVFSIGLPFYIHLAVALSLMFFRRKAVTIADCSDPYYDNSGYKRLVVRKWLEKLVLRRFDYVAIPMEEARESYAYYGIDDRIRIIPQGFAITQIADDAYRKNPVPMFCFAGVLYEKIRNPRYFLDYLLQVKQDFIFVVYALPDAFTMSLLKDYKAKLGDRLEIREPLPREELIHVMATMEFVVNFDNENSNQKPSKLIDYAMSKRPILSFNSRTFKADAFEEFLHGDYTQREQIDLSQYDIRTVVDKFEELFVERG